jgi:hypothetical protein
MTRSFVRPEDLRDLMGDVFGAARRLTGVYRLELDDRSTSGADLFVTNHAALTNAGVRVPALLALDSERSYLDADIAELYRYAQVLSLIEGPLRIADTDFPDRRSPC